MESWIKITVRRWCGNFQLTRRGLHLYILACVFLSSSTLFVISIELYSRFYLHGFLQEDGHLKLIDVTTEHSQDTLHLLPAAGPLSKKIPQAALSVFSGNHIDLLKPNLKGTFFKPMISPSLLAWDYHRNTTAPRKLFNCKKLIQADPEEQLRFKSWINSRSALLFSTLAEDVVPQMTSNCTSFKSIRGYKTTEGTPEERDYPLAHVILVHKDFEHVERLVRALYRPQNSFCIHVDSKASGKYIELILDRVLETGEACQLFKLYSFSTKRTIRLLFLKSVLTSLPLWHWLLTILNRSRTDNELVVHGHLQEISMKCSDVADCKPSKAHCQAYPRSLDATKEFLQLTCPKLKRVTIQL